MSDSKKNMSVPYAERIAARKFLVAIKDNELLGIWGALKKACEDLKIKDDDFPSYWTLTRLSDNPLSINTKSGDYKLYTQGLNQENKENKEKKDKKEVKTTKIREPKIGTEGTNNSKNDLFSQRHVLIEPEEMSEPSSISQLLEQNLFTPSVSNAGERHEWQGSRELFEILKKLSNDPQNIPIIQKQCTMNGVMYNATVIEIIISKMSFSLVNDQIFTLSDKELFQKINLFIGREKSLFRMMSL